jgi:leader peptidase (prepilin peptidase)/N-methyltransferase
VSSSLSAALLLGVLGLVSGWFVPALIRRIPEPDPDPVDAPDATTHSAHERDEADTTAPPEEPDPAPPADAEPVKELYADIAALPGLAWKSAVATAAVGALLGWAVGLETPLWFLAYLAPVGVALSVVDWRTRLLPTKVIAPSYLVVVVLAVLAALPGQDWDDLRRAGLGWLVSGGTFLLMWLIYPRGMGYGDVRLSGVLGIALGYLGWGPLLVGIYAGFLVGGLGGGLLSVLRVVERRSYPFGPFMFVGAVIGVVWGETVVHAYLYG